MPRERKTLCPACSKYRWTETVTHCIDCANELKRVQAVYHQVIAARPQLRTSSMGEVMERMWIAYQKLEEKCRSTS